MNSKKWRSVFYKGLIWSFVALYFLVAFISFYHCIAFCLVGNPMWISVMMSFAFEVGLALTLFSILTTDNNKTLVPWVLMVLLTIVQICGNVYSVFKYMVESGTNFYTYIQGSLLHWFVDDLPQGDIMSIISILLGALLPVVALLMTDMVANNIKLKMREQEESGKEDDTKTEERDISGDQEEKDDTKEQPSQGVIAVADPEEYPRVETKLNEEAISKKLDELIGKALAGKIDTSLPDRYKNPILNGDDHAFDGTPKELTDAFFGPSGDASVSDATEPISDPISEPINDPISELNESEEKDDFVQNLTASILDGVSTEGSYKPSELTHAEVVETVEDGINDMHHQTQAEDTHVDQVEEKQSELVDIQQENKTVPDSTISSDEGSDRLAPTDVIKDETHSEIVPEDVIDETEEVPETLDEPTYVPQPGTTSRIRRPSKIGEMNPVNLLGGREQGQYPFHTQRPGVQIQTAYDTTVTS